MPSPLRSATLISHLVIGTLVLSACHGSAKLPLSAPAAPAADQKLTLESLPSLAEMLAGQAPADTALVEAFSSLNLPPRVRSQILGGTDRIELSEQEDLALSRTEVQITDAPAVSDLAEAETAACDLACRTEAELARDLPLRQQQWLGAHNAYNQRGVFRNQSWSLTRQLEAGVRVIELDLKQKLGSGQVKVCHGAGTYDCLLNPFGVRDYAQLLQEIRAWSDTHPEQLLIVELENKAKNRQAVIAPLEKAFGDLIYRAEQRPENWADETPRQIVARGRRIIVGDYGPQRFDGKLIWNQNELSSNSKSKQFGPGCTVDGQPMAGKNWGFYDDRTFRHPKPFTPANLADYLSCDTRYLKIDRLDDQLINARHFAWAQAGPNDCASQSAGSPRWQGRSCAQALPFACSNRQGDWKISRERGPWSQGEAACRRLGPDYGFAVPRSYYQNQGLRLMLESGAAVWLAHRR